MIYWGAPSGPRMGWIFGWKCSRTRRPIWIWGKPSLPFQVRLRRPRPPARRDTLCFLIDTMRQIMVHPLEEESAEFEDFGSQSDNLCFLAATSYPSRHTFPFWWLEKMRGLNPAQRARRSRPPGGGARAAGPRRGGSCSRTKQDQRRAQPAREPGRDESKRQHETNIPQGALPRTG